MNMLLHPGQTAVLFDMPDASGATLGHYCTVVNVVSETQEEFPEELDRWLYRVFLAQEDRYRVVMARDLLGLDQSQPDASTDVDKAFEVQVDADDSDHERIPGRYRLALKQWVPFVFEKRSQPVPTYELRRQVIGHHLVGGELLYFVPREVLLSRQYVLRVLSELFGMADLAAND